MATASAAAGPAQSSYFGYGGATARNVWDDPNLPKDVKVKAVDECDVLVLVIGMRKGEVTTNRHGAGARGLGTLHTGIRTDMKVILGTGFKDKFKGMDVIVNTATVDYVIRAQLRATAPSASGQRQETSTRSAARTTAGGTS